MEKLECWIIIISHLGFSTWICLFLGGDFFVLRIGTLWDSSPFSHHPCWFFHLHRKGQDEFPWGIIVDLPFFFSLQPPPTYFYIPKNPTKKKLSQETPKNSLLLVLGVCFSRWLHAGRFSPPWRGAKRIPRSCWTVRRVKRKRPWRPWKSRAFGGRNYPNVGQSDFRKCRAKCFKSVFEKQHVIFNRKLCLICFDMLMFSHPYLYSLGGCTCVKGMMTDVFR